MDPTTVVVLMLIALILMVIMGIHIGISLGITALVGTWMMYEAYELAAVKVGSASFFALRICIFAVVTLCLPS